jgi:hypothetical protein
VTRLAIHISDAGITLLNSEQISYREPGFALLGDSNSNLTTGNSAFAQSRIDPHGINHRFWSNLDTQPLADKRFSHLSSADLVSRQLEQIWEKSGAGVSELVVAVPEYMSAQNLGLFLGIANELKLPVIGLVDAAVAATRREYKNAVPVHIDLSLHTAMLTRLAQPGMVQTDRTELLESCGIYALYDAWLHTIANAFVQQSRFDPLHTADSEQMLLNRLGGWLREAARQEQVEMELEFAGSTYQASIESLALIGTAAPIYQQIANKLRALFRAEDVPAIQVTDRIARLPGLADMLKARVGGEVFVLEPGATARGALSRCRGHTDADSGVSLIRKLPWDQSAVDIGQHTDEQSISGLPTHLLFGHTAYSIGNSPLVLGSEDSSGERVIELTMEMPGVSRRHCSLSRKNGQCVLEDHSRYGTYLNGNRIDGSSILQAGDSLRIGSPGFEFKLIMTDEKNG